MRNKKSLKNTSILHHMGWDGNGHTKPIPCRTLKLTDNYQEFFVEPGQALEANRAEYFWREAYRLLNDQIPTFLSDELSYKILKTGKSVAFLTNICKEKTNLGVKKKMGELKFQEIVPEMEPN